MSLLASAVTEWVSAVATGFTAAFAFAAVLQLFAIKRQTKQGALANVSESYGQISEQMASLRSILFEHHDWNKYFFNGDDPREAGVDDESEVGIQLGLVCDEIVDLADTIIEQRHTVPGAEMDWSTWELYLREIYQNSPLLQRYLRGNKQFYPDYVLTVFGYIIVRHADTGEVQSEWRVDERPSDRNGYPWYRTWEITKMRKENEAGDSGDLRFVAVVHPHKSGPKTADVKFSFSRPLLPAEQADRNQWSKVLGSWVLEVLRASSRLEKAKVVFDSQPELEVRLERSRWVVWRKKLPWHKEALRERYLAPIAPELEATASEQRPATTGP
jgi:hypothetical protein